MNIKLSNLILSIRNIPLNDKLSDEAVVALTNIHISLAGVIVANMLEDEYSDVAFHRESMEKLFAICRKRSASNQTLARCSRMIPALYNVFCMPDALFDDNKYNACLIRTFRVADKWREERKAGLPLDEKKRITEYGILQGILDAFTYVIDDDKQSDSDFQYLRHRIAEWLSEINDNNCWSGLSDYDAARRLDIMTAYLLIEHDNSFDIQIEKATEFYFERIILSNCVDSRVLFYIYRTMMSGIECIDYRKAGILADLATRIMNRSAACSDEWLWCAAVVIDRECAEINHNIKQKMLCHSA